MRVKMIVTAAMALALAVPSMVSAQQGTTTDQRSGQTSGQGQGTTRQQSQLSQQDRQFIQQAAISNMFEIQSSELALDHVDNDAVERFARRMIQDHQSASQQLQQIAQQKGVTPPQQLDAQHQQMMEQLRNASEDEFTSLYIRDQIRGHEQTIAAFERQAQQGQDPQLQTLARTLLPTLQEHLSMADDLRQQVPMAGSAQQQNQRQTPQR